MYHSYKDLWEQYHKEFKIRCWKSQTEGPKESIRLFNLYCRPIETLGLLLDVCCWSCPDLHPSCRIESLCLIMRKHKHTHISIYNTVSDSKARKILIWWSEGWAKPKFRLRHFCRMLLLVSNITYHQQRIISEECDRVIMRSRLIVVTTLSKQLCVTLMKLHGIYKLTVD